MKKLLIVVVGVLTMTACGNKTKSGETIDSTLVDSLMTDSVQRISWNFRINSMRRCVRVR